MNFFKSCTQPLSELSLSEDDVTVDNILRELLIYFGGFKCLIKSKSEIERKCEMEKKENYWSESDIKKAWRERERMDRKKKSAIKNWSRVIVLEELKRRLYDDKCKRQAEADVKEDEKTQACGNATRKIGKTDKKSFNTEPSMVSEERQIDNDYKQTRNNEEQVVINLVGAKPKLKADPPPHICIPLSYMSDKKKNYRPDDGKPFESSYKLIDRCPILTKGEELEDVIRKRKSYVMSYNNKTNNANWVYEILNPSTLAINVEAVKFENGYHKGHLAAAANHRWCLEAYKDASLFSNMAPQIESLNNSMWKRLENYCRKTAKEDLVRNVHVYTGPCYLYKTKVQKHYYFTNGKALPTHFFKVIIVENKNGEVKEPECYLIPNDPEAIKGKIYKAFKCNIKVIQKASGLTFLENVAEGTTIHINEIRWEGMILDKMGKGDYEGPCNAEIDVLITSALTDFV